MKKIILILMLIDGWVFASTGEKLYEKKCQSCHQMHVGDTKPMLAPPMQKISMRIKKVQPDKSAFITFVVDYIQHPSQDKGVCKPRAYRRFGTMPAVGKTMTQAQRIAVATWLHDSFKPLWNKAGKNCEDKGQ